MALRQGSPMSLQQNEILADFQLTFAELREKNVKRCEEVFHPLNEWSVTDWTGAFVGEIGESIEVLGKLIKVANTAKKLRRLEGADKHLDTDKLRVELKKQLAEEVADVVIYGDLLLASEGMSLEEAIAMKFNKVSAERFSSYYL